MRAAHRSSLSRGLLAAALWVFGPLPSFPVVAFAQEPVDPGIFRTSIDLVRLDASVVDTAGRPVTDLRRSDFEIRQDGNVQRVLFAEFRRGAGMTGHAAGGTGSRSTPRRIVVVVDDLRMGFDSVVRVREGIVAALLQNRAPDDEALIVGTRDAPGRTIAFTGDPATLRAQAGTLRWEAPTRHALPDPNERRRHCMNLRPAGDALDVEFGYGPLRFIASLVSELRTRPGRKIILLLADGVDDLCPESRATFDERVRRLADVAARSSSIIYALQTRPFSSGVRMPDARARAGDVVGTVDINPGRNEVSERMKKLAEPTGGYARRSNDPVALVTAALTHEDGYYVLAYEPPPGTFTSGKLRYRKLAVRVSRPGVTVRSRTGFYSLEDSALR